MNKVKFDCTILIKRWPPQETPHVFSLSKIVPWQGAQLYDLKNGAEFSSDVFYALPRPSPWIEENS